MNIYIVRAKRYGGAMTFALSFIENNTITSRDVLFLDNSVELDVKEKLEEEFNGVIILLPKITIKNTIFYRFIQNLSILFTLIKYKNISNIYCLDWNLVLDWLLHISPYRIYSFVHTYPVSYLPRIVKLFIKGLLKKSTITTVSNYSADQIVDKWYIPKVEVLYNYSKLKGNKRNVPANKEKIINITTIAHCEEYKNPELWLNLARTLTDQDKNIHFHWYGDGTLLKKYQKDTKNNKQIIFHGRSDAIEEILLNQTSVYFQCSKMESLGISILDAMNYSLPSIVSRVGGMPELVLNNYSGFVCNDADEMIQGFKELIYNPKKHLEMSKNAKTRYESHFSQEKWLEKLSHIVTNFPEKS